MTATLDTPAGTIRNGSRVTVRKVHNPEYDDGMRGQIGYITGTAYNLDSPFADGTVVALRDCTDGSSGPHIATIDQVVEVHAAPADAIAADSAAERAARYRRIAKRHDGRARTAERHAGERRELADSLDRVADDRNLRDPDMAASARDSARVWRQVADSDERHAAAERRHARRYRDLALDALGRTR